MISFTFDSFGVCHLFFASFLPPGEQQIHHPQDSSNNNFAWHRVCHGLVNEKLSTLYTYWQ